MSGTVKYRYKCATENALVWEERAVSAGAPTVCVNEGAALVAGTLTIVDQPTETADLVVTSTVDFDGATIANLSHTSLTNIGSNTHAQLDTHVADATQHRTINDSGSAATDLWSANKINSELGGKAASSHTHTASDVADFDSAADTRADGRITAQKGQANGLATLDGTGKVPASQLTISSVVYKGTWNASTNTPALADGTGDKGEYYVVSTAGSTSVDGITNWEVGDWIIFNGSVWEKNDNTDQVTSVAGKQGAVTLVAADITDFESTVSANTNVAANTSHGGNTSNPHSVTLDQVSSASSKGDLLAHNGTVHVVRSVGSNGHVLQADSTQASGLKWASNKKFITSSRNTLKTTEGEWVRVDHFIYPGSVIAAVDRVLINSQAESGVTYDVRLYDVTNGNEIAKVTGKTNTIPAISDLGTPSNVPSGDAQWEVHVKRTAGSDPNGALYYSVMVEYQ